MTLGMGAGTIAWQAILRLTSRSRHPSRGDGLAPPRRR